MELARPPGIRNWLEREKAEAKGAVTGLNNQAAILQSLLFRTSNTPLSSFLFLFIPYRTIPSHDPFNN